MKKISSSLFNKLEEDAEARLKKEIFLELRNDPNDVCKDYQDNELKELVEIGFSNAKSFKIETDLGFAAFVMMTVLCGPNFYKENEVATFIRSGDDPDSRIDELADYYIDHHLE